MPRWLKRALISLLLAFVVLAIVVRVRHGGGVPYPDLTGPALLPESALEVAVQFDQPIGNVAVDVDGRVFFTVHPESRPEGDKLFVSEAGKIRPFPASDLQAKHFETPLGVRIDRQNRLWVIDHGSHGFGTARLTAWNLADGNLAHEYRFSSTTAPKGSFLQDLAIDAQGSTVFIADVAFWAKRPAILVHDIASGSTKRLLENDPSVTAQDYLIRTPAKTMTFFGGLAALKAGVDGITLSRDDAWLYFGAMNHPNLYRINRLDLMAAAQDSPALTKAVQEVGPKPLSDGLTTDVDGNVYVTDVEHGAVFRLNADGELETLIQSPKIRWADGFSFGPDGWLYLADSAIPEQMLRSRAHIRSQAPYFIYRFKPGVEGVPGQ
ncbi:MAG: SMP-30/gluconolactonase/LRE family protein [Ahniella sp.]|nr:SMP-30/gluconolactonase/LRE family protein [Ahniella sp.]